MRIGIITFHCAYNFGSSLQTVALKHRLEAMGHNVRVIDYRGRDFSGQYALLRTPPTAKSLVADALYYPRNRRRRDSFESFMRLHMSLTDRFTEDDEPALCSLRDTCDCFVCGSDQIWNIDCTRGPVGPFFLSFAGDKRRVAYAPSLAHTSFSVEYFGDGARGQVASWLDDFYAISVREAATVPLLRDLTDKHIDVCLDPTLLLDGECYEAFMAPEGICGDCSSDIFAYMLEPNPELIAYVETLSRETGLRVSYVSKRPVSFSVPSRNLYGMGPDGFLRAILDSRCVVTNSFHATVFSILFGRPFMTFATSKSGSRMTGLLKDLGLSDHLIEGGSPTMPDAPDSAAVAARLSPLRASSEAFLARALEE